VEVHDYAFIIANKRNDASGVIILCWTFYWSTNYSWL